jgi:putative MATE family efflux protein
VVKKLINLNVDLTKDKILRSLIIFAIPILISNVFQQLYNTTDTMIVGNFLGDTSLAAIGACSAVYELLVGFALGVGNGMSIVVARSYGAKDETLLKRSVAAATIIGILLTLAIMIISRLGLYPLLRLLDTPEEIINESYSYISTITLFVGVMFAYNLFAGFLRAIGDSFTPLLFLVVSSIINAILAFLFITEFHMGVRGSAVATVIAQGISAVLCLIYIYVKKPILIPRRKHFSFDKGLYSELAGQGFSMGFMLAIVSSGTVILQRSINGIGYLTIAAHTAARKLNSFFMMPGATVSAALTTFVSQNKGADNRDRIIKGVNIGFKLAIAWGVIATILMLLFSRPLIALLSGSNEAVILDNGSLYLKINAPFYAVLGILLILRTSLQGLGQKVVPLISSVIEFFGKVVFALLCIPVLGYFGVIICEPVIWCLMCIQLLYSFFRNPYIRNSGRNNVAKLDL